MLQLAGPRRAYAIAALLFGLGTLACALAPTMPVMVGARAIQGFGGGILFALSFAMIRLVFDPSLWPRAMALISGMWGVAVLVGPAVGGMFADHGAWRGAFFVLLPAIALFAALALIVLPRPTATPAERSVLPLPQLVLLAAALLAVSAGSVAPEPMQKAAWIAAAVGLGTLLIRTEQRTRHRLLPRGAFAGELAALYVTLSLTAITVTVTEIFIPLFLQVLHGQSPFVAGYLAALMAAGWTIASLISGSATGQAANRAIIATPILTLAGMLALLLLVPDTSSGLWFVLLPICLSLFSVGFGVGLGWPHLLTRVLLAADRDEQDLAAGSLTTVQLVVSAFGAALSGMVANLAGLTDPGGTSGTAHAAVWLFGLFAVPPALAVLTAIRCAGQNGRQFDS